MYVAGRGFSDYEYNIECRHVRITALLQQIYIRMMALTKSNASWFLARVDSILLNHFEKLIHAIRLNLRIDHNRKRLGIQRRTHVASKNVGDSRGDKAGSATKTDSSQQGRSNESIHYNCLRRSFPLLMESLLMVVGFAERS